MTKKPPDYLVIGHVSKDLLDGGGHAAGGTALYSAVAAQRLGVQAALVTSCAPADDHLLDLARNEGVWIERVASPATTTFSNHYDAEGNRTQVLSAQARMLTYRDVPPEWVNSSIVHLGPIAQELSEDLPGRFAGCGLLGITPQGWMRRWDSLGKVEQSASPVPVGLLELPSNSFLVVSMEDLGHRADIKQDYANLAPLVAVTNGRDEAHLCQAGSCFPVPALSATIVDPTGAGDVFAATLFIRYMETGNLLDAALFAHAAAALNIEGRGPAAVPRREQVHVRLKTAGARP